MDEHVRHRAVERLEGEPSQVARTSADATEGHLGHSLRREARGEAVAQVASAVDVDVAHRVVVGPRKDREDSRRLSSCLAAPMGATSWPTSLSQKVTNAPMSFVKARATVTLCSATPGGTVDCCVGDRGLDSSRERIIFAGECLWEFFFSLGARNPRDGSYRLQPGERLSWEQEIPETDLIAQPGERLSWEQEIPETDLIASNLVSASPGSKKSPRRILSPPAR